MSSDITNPQLPQDPDLTPEDPAATQSSNPDQEKHDADDKAEGTRADSA